MPHVITPGEKGSYTCSKLPIILIKEYEVNKINSRGRVKNNSISNIAIFPHLLVKAKFKQKYGS